MKENKFRGLGVNGDWYYGLLSESQGKEGHQPPKGFYISNAVGMPWAYQVRPETIGQYIDSSDKNNKEIYELDIVKNEYSAIVVVKWDTELVGFSPFAAAMDRYGYAIFDNADKCEIIGNVPENPELIV